MTVRVGINGFGRIGRNFFRAVRASGADVDIVAANDLADAKMNAHLLKYDSTHGRYPDEISVIEGGIKIGSKEVKLFSERASRAAVGRPRGGCRDRVDGCVHRRRQGQGPHRGWGQEGHHLGAGDQRGRHDRHGRQRSRPTTLARTRSSPNASCTTNCFVPMIKVLDDAFGVEKGLMTTVHAYTNDQNLLDLVHTDPRRARAAAVNIVPASTGAARATSLVLESMKGRLDGTALRVPVQDGSITDFTGVLNQEVTIDEINAAFKAAATSGPLSKYLVYSDEPLVSSDIVGSPASCTFDSKLTMALGSMVKILGWYDNEWGYSNRLVDLAIVLGGRSSRTWRTCLTPVASGSWFAATSTCRCRRTGSSRTTCASASRCPTS